VGGFRHGGQSLDELTFRAVEILELFNEQLLQCGDGRHVFVLGLRLLPTKCSDQETDQKSARQELQGVFLDAIARQVEGVVYLLFYGVDVSGGMFLDVLNDLSGISLEMIRVFDEGVASAGKCVFGHIDKHDHTPGTNFSNGVYTPQGDLPLHSSIESEVELLSRGIPPFIRLPKPGQRCPHTGLSRTSLTELIAPCTRNGNQPPVSAVYKRSHARARRGVWQIPTRNLFRYLLDQRKNTAQSYAAMKEARQAS